MRHAEGTFIRGQPRQRAHPDLNQGPADLQSAALTTELCTRMPGWFPACWLQGRRVVFFLRWLKISVHACARFCTFPTLESQGPGAHFALLTWRRALGIASPANSFVNLHRGTQTRFQNGFARALRAQGPSLVIKRKQRPLYPPIKRVSCIFSF